MGPTLRIVRGQRAAAEDVGGEDAVGLHEGDGGEGILVGDVEPGGNGVYRDAGVFPYKVPDVNRGRSFPVFPRQDLSLIHI